MKATRFMSTMLLTACICGAAGADDGELNNKSMSHTINVPIFDSEFVNEGELIAEHAFTSIMGFYVPSQNSAGALTPIEYYDIDGTLRETLEVAKPLVNVFIYGPAFEVEGTAFEHSYWDVYGAVSFDDGQTFKKTNLSESAEETVIFTHNDEEGETSSVPHTLSLESTRHPGTFVDHAVGGELPYSGINHCTECHGSALQGTIRAPSCFRCHSSNYDDGEHFDEPIPEEFGPIVFYDATLTTDEEDNMTISGRGVNADSEPVTLVNGATGDSVGITDAPVEGRFNYAFPVLDEEPPCSIAAAGGEDGQSPAIAVMEDGKKVKQNQCVGVLETDDTILGEDQYTYPGGVYNVFHSVASNELLVAENKVLVAWPSRYCEQGQPAYAMAWDGDDEGLSEDQLAKRDAIVGLFNETSDFDLDEDLYLTDLFGVAGQQGSIDFADEGYPQAGIVPFGCVWTARGVVLPGDDPRTTETESSHIVWTKAERLTSGRRDPNRIEVQGIAGAGFVVTWQEDPDGLRPGQGLGPGEGWSGAVAHDKTDVWYSFIPWEYFDLVETEDDETAYENIAEHDLDVSGRPQVFVPMAVPMRLTNNDKCNAEEYGPGETPSENKEFSYCNFGVAESYGLQDFCADTVDIPQGKDGTPGPICVNEDGLPNVANTAATRPRLSLQGYDSDGDNLFDSAWVIVAAEESKGLGRFEFLPDGTPCESDGAEAGNPDCLADEGKNQWYFSFDMGDPDTSATADAEFGLVQNLVNQGNMLNQPEVDWREGEFYPVMDTEEMWDFGDYNFELYNTEIARRASLLVQPLVKATNSTYGLLATPSWKQGAMRQGGPADTMLRRISLSTIYPSGGDCPVVDAEQPVITSAIYDPNGEKVVLEGEGADGDNGTKVLIRDAVTQGSILDESVTDRKDGTFKATVSLNADGPIPCAIQAADEGDDPIYGPWTYVEGAEEVCENPVEVGCEPYWNVGEGIDNNPYAFANMKCESWLVDPDTNPYYPDGLCEDPATNLSGTIPDVCIDDGADGAETDCPEVDFGSSTYGTTETNPILQGYIQQEGNTTRVLEWHQCPSDYSGDKGDIKPVSCDDDDRDDEFADNLQDQSWYNPLEVSKGHRGFIDGDFVMFLYAWSPNWRLNTKGHDRYELYIRRSFDGGDTWGVLPSSFTATNGESYTGEGTTTCETYRSSEQQIQGSAEYDEPKHCYDFDAGAREHARNVTQHKSMRITTLDPRYSSSKASIPDTCVSDLELVAVEGVTVTWSCNDTSDLQGMDTDVRNPSRYFIAFETGDNTTVEVGEAEPLDLFYGRAENFGDYYTVWSEIDTGLSDPEDDCYPSNPQEMEISDVIDGSGFCNEFDRMNTGGTSQASEASLTSNPDASKLYGVWTQEAIDPYTLEPVSDAQARRIWWIDNFIPEDSYTLPGSNNE